MKIRGKRRRKLAAQRFDSRRIYPNMVVVGTGDPRSFTLAVAPAGTPAPMVTVVVGNVTDGFGRKIKPRTVPGWRPLAVRDLPKPAFSASMNLTLSDTPPDVLNLLFGGTGDVVRRFQEKARV